MTVNVTKGPTKKHVASDRLARTLVENGGIAGDLFIGYPIVATASGPYVIDALLLSPHHGIIIFDLVEGNDPGDYRARQDDIANKLEARLRNYPNLMDRRDLRIAVHVMTYGPAVPAREQNDDYLIVTTDEALMSALSGFSWPHHSASVLEAALSAIENIATVRQPLQKRTVKATDSRGAKLEELEQSIATLDKDQNRAVIETANGIQRIRGLAGSGKTIVLALKAAYLHVRYPEWRIAVTFQTRSLKAQFRRLIHNFVLEQAHQEPNWDRLRVVNAWGGRRNADRDGIYSEFCRLHDADYFPYDTARRHFRNRTPFADACEHALGQAREHRPAYDAILVDEAQDFPPAFLRLCYALLDDHKRLIYAYDELQSLTEMSLPSPQEIFSPGSGSAHDVQFPGFGYDPGSSDIILKRCYRNSRPVLTTAHALGFGIYRQPPENAESGLIQMFDRPTLWTDTGYAVTSGTLADGNRVVLQRNSETSPDFLETHSSRDDLIRFEVFETVEEQNAWLVEAIRNNLQHDELRHDDIMVINPDPRTTRDNVSPVRRQLFEMEINSHIAGVDTDPDVFFRTEDQSITFTGVHRAKGNEAGMVYIVNAHESHSAAFNLATLRNQLFTAITRSKAWIRVVGVGPEMEMLRQEYEALKARDFSLAFTYPTADERQHLRIVHRDMTEAESKSLKAWQRQFTGLVSGLESGDIQAADFDPALLSKFFKLIGSVSDAD